MINNNIPPYATNYSWYTSTPVVPPSDLKEIEGQFPENQIIETIPKKTPSINKNNKNDAQQHTRPEEKQPQNLNNLPSDKNKTKESEANSNTEFPDANSRAGQGLTEEELQLVEKLKLRDAEVKSHEMAHIAAGGQYITSGAKLEFQKGPDGRDYAVGGEVSIDTSPIPGDPEATAQKMRQIQHAALAPASPSSQDRKVASKAASIAAKSLSELMMLRVKERTGTNDDLAFGSHRIAAESYAKVNNTPIEPQSGMLHTIA